MKNIFKFALVAFLGLGLSSCLKDEEFDAGEVGLNADNISTKPVIEIVGGGISNFRNHALSVDLAKASDTSRFTISYTQGGNAAPEDITINFAYDGSAFSSYNADTVFNSKRIRFEKLPDSTFSFPKTSVTIKKGQKISEAVNFIVFPAKVDPSKIYLFPITITSTSSSNAIISGNKGTIYFHIIGNALAGKYNVVGTRYNYNSGSVAWTFPAPYPTPTNTVNITASNPVKVATAADGQSINLDIANIGLGVLDFQYVITGDANFVNLTLGYNSIFLSQSQVKFSRILNYNFIGTGTATNPKPTFRLITHYNNAVGGTGNDRIIDETFTHQ